MAKPLRLTLNGKIFFALVNLAGVSAFVWSFAHVATDLGGPDLSIRGYGALWALTLVASITIVRIPGITSLISITEVFIFCCVIFFGPFPAAFLAGAEGFLNTRRLTDRFVSQLSTLSVLTLSVLAAGFTYETLLKVSTTAGAPYSFVDLLIPVGGMALVDYAINSWLVACLSALTRRGSIVRMWRENYLWTSLTFFSGALGAVLAYTLYVSKGPTAILIALPILAITLVTYRTFLGRVEEKNRRIEEMNKVHLQTIEALTMAIDAKGQTTYGHPRRVQGYAVALCEVIGVDAATLEGIRTAAFLHDVGKLAVPDYILNKPGILTPAEREKLRTYPRIGAEMLSNVRFPHPVAPMIRHHQERWDGTGYPDGLAGEQIPFGARVLAIADCADAALRCPRAHRESISREELKALLRRESGVRYDPAIVGAFCTHLDEIEGTVENLALPQMEGMAEIANIHREHAATLFVEESSRAALKDISASRDEALHVYDLAKHLSASISLKETLAVVMDKMRTLVSFDTGVIWLLQSNTDHLLPAHVVGEEVEHLRRKVLRKGEGLSGWAVENRKTLINKSPELDFNALDMEIAALFKCATVIPLLTNGLCIGAITLYDRHENHFDLEDERILDLIAPQVSAAIQNAQSFEETKDKALTDSLTGLPNSRYLYMHLDQEMARARRSGHPLGIVVVDLDHFKPINDTYGHHVGDEVLREVARFLSKQFRAGDLVCRWAGDEFVILLPETDMTTVESSVLRAQRGVDEFGIVTSAGQTVHVGASAGWAVYPSDGDGFEELMRVADKRMYHNKTDRHEAAATTSA